MMLTICGSLTFAKEMVEAQKTVQSLGFKCDVPWDIKFHLENEDLIDNMNLDLEHGLKHDVLGKSFEQVENADAILVLNYKKNGVEGYIGASTLMEMGVAYHLGKKLFVLNQVPDPEEQRWALEVHLMKPVFLEGDLGKLEK